MPQNQVVVIGSGFSSLSSAIYLADKGFKVTIVEKNDTPGGRARIFNEGGFLFDMGPSWYWMPDIFEKFFNLFGKSTSDYYELKRLDPSYRMIFGKNDFLDVPAQFENYKKMFEELEPGSSSRLEKFLDQGKYKYQVGINQLVYKPSLSITEFADPRLLYDILRMDTFISLDRHMKKFFRHPKILRLMEFPVLFLGGTAKSTPALYSLMNYADIKLGTWYPMGGMFRIVEAMVKLAREKGVDFKMGHEVSSIEVKENQARQVHTSGGSFKADVVVAGSDYHHVEAKLLAEEYRNYSESYWDKRVLAPGALIFYLGVNKKIKNLLHHNLFFDEDLGHHSFQIYNKPSWPDKPLFYVCAPSKTDPTVAPEGKENLFILMPVAPALKDDEKTREKYFDLIIRRIEDFTGDHFRNEILYKKSYAHTEFIRDYHSYKGNAYGLANTLRQTAILKPSLINKKIKNLYYTGQLTVPGPGVPPALISGQVVAREIEKVFSA